TPTKSTASGSAATSRKFDQVWPASQLSQLTKAWRRVMSRVLVLTSLPRLALPPPHISASWCARNLLPSSVVRSAAHQKRENAACTSVYGSVSGSAPSAATGIVLGT